MNLNRRLLGENIRVERMLLGLTQKELAEKLNNAPSRLCNWERGTRTPSIEYLLKISHVLGISISKLVSGIYS